MSFRKNRALVMENTGYSRQNLRKSDCSSFRVFKNILPFSVPITKTFSLCTATQATSVFSLESAEHCGGEFQYPGFRKRISIRRAVKMVQWIKCLPSKHKDLSSIPSIFVKALGERLRVC